MPRRFGYSWEVSTAPPQPQCLLGRREAWGWLELSKGRSRGRESHERGLRGAAGSGRGAGVVLVSLGASGHPWGAKVCVTGYNQDLGFCPGWVGSPTGPNRGLSLASLCGGRTEG